MSLFDTEKIFGDAEWITFVAEHEGKLVGFIECSLRDRAPGCRADRIGYIEGWYVISEFRNQGVGRKLVKQGGRWARGMGCTEMASDTTSEYPLSPAVHKAPGYGEVKRKYFYRKDLGQR